MPRLLLRSALLLLVGAVITIAVAWGCVWRIDGMSPDAMSDAAAVQRGASHEMQPRWDNVTRVDQFGTTVSIAIRELVQPLPWMPPGGDRAEIERWTAMRDRRAAGLPPEGFDAPAPDVVPLVAGSALRSRPSSEVRNLAMIIEDARGWPLRAVAAYTMSVPDKPPVHQGGIDRQTAQGLLGLRTQLPLRPLWPGFIANTVLYAALAGALWSGVGAARRIRRRRRGQCMRCGYRLAGAARCSECGTEPPPTARASIDG